MQDFAIFNLADYARAAAFERERAIAAGRQTVEYRRLTATGIEHSLMRKLIAGPSGGGRAAQRPAASAR